MGNTLFFLGFFNEGYTWFEETRAEEDGMKWSKPHPAIILDFKVKHKHKDTHTHTLDTHMIKRLDLFDSYTRGRHIHSKHGTPISYMHGISRFGLRAGDMCKQGLTYCTVILNAR